MQEEQQGGGSESGGPPSMFLEVVENFLEINRQFALTSLLQHDLPIERCLLHIRVFFGGKTKSPCFDLFIHWLIKQTTNTYQNYFSRSYENRSIYIETERTKPRFKRRATAVPN